MFLVAMLSSPQPLPLKSIIRVGTFLLLMSAAGLWAVFILGYAFGSLPSFLKPLAASCPQCHCAPAITCNGPALAAPTPSAVHGWLALALGIVCTACISAQCYLVASRKPTATAPPAAPKPADRELDIAVSKCVDELDGTSLCTSGGFPTTGHAGRKVTPASKLSAVNRP